MTTLLLALSLGASCLVSPNAQSVRTDVDYAKLFAGGESFTDFLANAKERKELWHGNYEKAAVPDALLARATRVTGSWNVLIVAVDSCSDSVSTIPFIAKLVEQMPNVTLRIVHSKVGKEVMERHRTPDGRAATPTLILLDSAYMERGCFIERPGVLRELMAAPTAGDTAAFTNKMNWYEKDQGASTVEEFVTMLERASRGEAACDAKP